MACRVHLSLFHQLNFVVYETCTSLLYPQYFHISQQIEKQLFTVKSKYINIEEKGYECIIKKYNPTLLADFSAYLHQAALPQKHSSWYYYGLRDKYVSINLELEEGETTIDKRKKEGGRTYWDSAGKFFLN